MIIKDFGWGDVETDHNLDVLIKQVVDAIRLEGDFPTEDVAEIECFVSDIVDFDEHQFYHSNESICDQIIQDCYDGPTSTNIFLSVRRLVAEGVKQQLKKIPISEEL